MSYKVPLRIISIPIEVVGIIANCFSLAFFIRRQKYGLGNRLLMLLNSFDLLVCIGILMVHITFSNYGDEKSQIFRLTGFFINALSFDCTGYSTCLISVTRTIKICRPFFQINGRWVAGSFVFYFLCSFTREFLGYTHFMKGIKPIADLNTTKKYYSILFPSLTTANMITVIISSLVTVYWLRNKNEFEDRNSRSSKHATITVLILSGVYSVMNTLYVSGAALSFCIRLNVIVDNGTLWAYREIVLALAPIVNSTVNPIIYLLRKKEMRKFASDVRRTVKQKFVYMSVKERTPTILNLSAQNIITQSNVTDRSLIPETISFPCQTNKSTRETVSVGETKSS